MEELLKPLISVAAILFVTAVIFFKSREKRQQTEAQKEIQLALLNKFESGEELSRFLATDEGRSLIDNVSATPMDSDPRHHAVGLTIAAGIMTAMAIGFTALVVSGIMPDKFLVAPAAIGAVGIGLTIGAVMAWRIANEAELRKDR